MSDNNYRTEELSINNSITTPNKHKRTKKWYGTEDPSKLPPFNWLENARIYNHSYEKVPIEGVLENTDIIILYFSMRNSYRSDNIIHKFYEFYDFARLRNLPIEVINVPMDETREDMCISYEEQADWFTLMFDDPIIITLQYRHEVSSVPHLVVTKGDGSMVSSHGILDLDEFGKNAFIAWLSQTAYTKFTKKISRDKKKNAQKLNSLNPGAGNVKKHEYITHFSKLEKLLTPPVLDIDALVERSLKAERENDKEEEAT
ncbi:hypothetical protein HW555_001211 [Spodoptera exigua]|uniref:protein-disulfide reductase n=1 Tax=Spodoptera exigua TaxID=7107 RepID=A0A835GQE1_SPOEX|nr:hypothetical protein HW555_001211 [Spodoptera exigua]